MSARELTPAAARDLARRYNERAPAANRVDRDAWRDRAACADDDPELWYDAWESPDPAEAVRICREVCTVRMDCLWDSLDGGGARAHYQGVRGGLTAAERSTVKEAADRARWRAPAAG